MRETKFRGRKNTTKEWIYGSLISDKTQGYAIVQIMDNPVSYGVINGWCFGIEKGTECQYTGLKDKNGKEIYEGDIIQYVQHHFNTDMVKIKVKAVKYNYDRWNIYSSNAGESDIEIIGNIFENPELLETKKV